MSLLPRISFVFILLTITTACSTFFGDRGVFRSRGEDYLKTGAIEKVKVPEDMQVTSLEELYVVRALNVKDEFGDKLDFHEYEIPRPLPFSNDDSGIAVKIQSQMGRRWIYLSASTAQVWPQTQSFLSEYGINVSRSIASEGLIETDWVYFKDDEATRARFRILIEKSVHPETTEVHVLQVEMPRGEALPEDFSWPEASDNSERAKWLTDELAGVLAEGVANNAASLMGQNVGGNEKVNFSSVNGEPVLHIQLPYARARSSLAHALKSEGFVTWEFNVNKKVFYFDYLPPEATKRGFFSRMAFWKSSAELPEDMNHGLSDVLARLDDSPQARKVFDSIPGSSYGEALPSSQGYLLVMKSEQRNKQERQDVIVRDFRGAPVPVKEAKDLLRTIRTNLL